MQIDLPPPRKEQRTGVGSVGPGDPKAARRPTPALREEHQTLTGAHASGRRQLFLNKWSIGRTVGRTGGFTTVVGFDHLLCGSFNDQVGRQSSQDAPTSWSVSGRSRMSSPTRTSNSKPLGVHC